MSSLPAQRVLVLGGTGFIGAAVAERLRHCGAEVVIAARRAMLRERWAPLEDYEFIQLDVEKVGDVERALDGVSLVVHAIGRSLPAESNADPISDATTALVSILRTLEALKYRPDIRLFYVSSGGAIYGNPVAMPIEENSQCAPISSYGIMKLAAEKYLAMYRELYGIQSTALRVANAYGPRQPVRSSQGFVAKCLDAVRHSIPITLYGGGANVRDFVFIEDVAQAIVGIAESTAPPSAINIGSGIGTSLIDVLGIVEKVTGCMLEVEHVPGRSVDVSSIVLSTERLSSLVDWRPLDLVEGARRTWEHLQAAPETREGTA